MESAGGEISPTLFNGEVSPLLIPEDFNSSLLTSNPVGKYETSDTSTIIFMFDLVGTLVDTNAKPKESALHFITTVNQVCRAMKKTPLFFTYSEYVSDEQRLSKARALEQGLGFNFNSHSRILLDLPQQKEYDTVAEIYNNTFNLNIDTLKYPVFFFDDSLEQVRSMHSTARTAYLENPHIYFRSFYILDNSSWDHALTEVVSLIRQREPLAASATQSRPLSKPIQQGLWMTERMPSGKIQYYRRNSNGSIIRANFLEGGKRSRKNKVKVKKSRKQLRR